MPLTALGIKKAGDGRLADGNGLSLEKKADGGKWIWRYSFAGKRREMGLGTWPTVSLADARKERDRWALALSQGKDPISERNAAKAARLEALTRRDPPLEQPASARDHRPAKRTRQRVGLPRVSRNARDA